MTRFLSMVHRKTHWKGLGDMAVGQLDGGVDRSAAWENWNRGWLLLISENIRRSPATYSCALAIALLMSRSRSSISCSAFLRENLPENSWRHSWRNLSNIDFWRVSLSLPTYSVTCSIRCWHFVIAHLRRSKVTLRLGSFNGVKRLMTLVAFSTTRESFSILSASSVYPTRILVTTWSFGYEQRTCILTFDFLRELTYDLWWF